MALLSPGTFPLAMEIWFSLRLQRWQEWPRELIVDAALVSEGSVVNCYCTSRQLTPDWFRHQRNPTDKESCKKRILTKCQKKYSDREDTVSVYLCQMNQREPERNWKIEISGLRTGGCHPCRCRCQWCRCTTRRSSPGNIWLMQPSCVGYVRPLHVKFATKKDNAGKNWDGLCLRLVRACVVSWRA